MGGIKIREFFGRIPAIGEHLLPDGYAQIAKNCFLDSGYVQPIDGMTIDTSVILPAANPIKSVFLNYDSWFYSSEVADYVKSPVHDINNRIYFTNDYGAYEKDDLISAPRPLGIKPPVDPLTIELDPTSSTEDVLRSVSYVYTRVSKWGEESRPSRATATVDVKSDQTVKLSGFSNGGDNFIDYVRVYRVATGTQGASFEMVPYQKTAGSLQYDENGNVIFDVPIEDVDDPTEYFLDKVDDTDLGEVLITTDWDEPPRQNLVSNGDFQMDDTDPCYWTVTVNGTPVTQQVVSITDATWMQGARGFEGDCDDATEWIALTSDEYLEVDETIHYNISAYAKYVSGTSQVALGINMYDSTKTLLGNLTPVVYAATSSWAQVNGVIHPSSETSETYHFTTGTKYVKLVCYPQKEAIGASIITRIRFEEGQSPSTDLKGLTYVGNGVLAGFIGRTIYFCEPFYYYAWPKKYALSMESSIVGIGNALGQIIVVTEDYVYTIDGYSPDSYSKTKIEYQQGGISRRSIVDSRHGVIFAGQDGLFLAIGNNLINITKNLYTKKQWRTLNPANLVSFIYADKYLGFFEGTNTGLIVDPNQKQVWIVDIELSSSYGVYGGHFDPFTDKLYLSIDDGSGCDLYKWDDDIDNPLTAIWKSKKFITRKLSFSVAYVRSSGGVILRTYANGSNRDSISINNNMAKINGGYKADEWEFEITGTESVYTIAIGQTTEDVIGL